MEKIPFDIKYRPEIEAGKYRVITSGGEPVRVICWDRRACWPVVGLVERVKTGYDGETIISEEIPVYAEKDGRCSLSENHLFLVPAEPELTELEITLLDWMSFDCAGRVDMETMKGCVRNRSKELLNLARKQLQPEIDAEVGKAYKKADKIQFKRGREEAMKGMPRWKKCVKGELIGQSLFYDAISGLVSQPLAHHGFAPGQGFFIHLSELIKLPKEDKK